MLIAIDPDIDRSGYAIIDGKTLTDAGCASFPELCDILMHHAQSAEPPTIVVEAGWLNTALWHDAYYKGTRVAGRIGRNTGANHQTGKLIAQMAEHYDLRVRLQKPLAKRWRGKDKKITQEELELILKGNGIEHPNKRMNQDVRDAVLIAIHNL